MSEPTPSAAEKQLTPLDLAIRFHNIYERLAPDFGYETRIESQDFSPDTPNGKLMVAVCAEILKHHLPHYSGQAVDRQGEWTPERVKDYLKWSDGVEKLAMDFTAELAAERQRTKEQRVAFNNAEYELANSNAKIHELQQHLTAERQRREQADEYLRDATEKNLKLALAKVKEKP